MNFPPATRTDRKDQTLGTRIRRSTLKSLTILKPMDFEEEKAGRVMARARFRGRLKLAPRGRKTGSGSTVISKRS